MSASRNGSVSTVSLFAVQEVRLRGETADPVHHLANLVQRQRSRAAGMEQAQFVAFQHSLADAVQVGDVSAAAHLVEIEGGGAGIADHQGQ